MKGNVYTDQESRTDVFISYKSSNVDFARNLVNELTEHNISVWFDKDKLSKEAGKEYADLIKKGIDHTQIVLFLYTGDIETTDSTFIINEELSYARSKGKKICCYACDKVDFKNMLPDLRDIVHDIQWLANGETAAHITEYQESIKDERKRMALAATIRDFSTSSSVFQDINLFLIRIAVQRLLGHPTPFGTYSTLCKSDSIYEEGGGIEMLVEKMAFYIPVPSSREKELKELKFFKDYEELKDNERECVDLVRTLSPEEDTIKGLLKSYIEKHYDYEEIYEWLSSNYTQYCPASNEGFELDVFLQIVAESTADTFIRQIEEENKTMFNGAMLGVYDISDVRTQNVERHELTIKLYHSDYFTFKCMVEVYHILRSVRNTFVYEDIKADIKKFSPFLCSIGMGGFIIATQDDYQTIMWAKRSNTISSGEMWHFSFDETVNFVKDAVREKTDEGEGYIKSEEGRVRIDPYKTFYRALNEENGLKVENLTENRGVLSIGIITSERLEIELLSYACVRLEPGSSIPMQMRRFHHRASDGYLEISKYEFRSLNDSVNNYTGRLLTPESYYLAEIIQQDSQLLTDPYVKRGIKIGRMVSIGKDVKIGSHCLIEDFSTISDNCIIGEYCKIHRNVFIDEGVKIGNKVKIQNNNSIYHGVSIADGVFIGTNVCFTNDVWPRSVKPDGEVVTGDDWTLSETKIGYGASIGAGAVIRCGIKIGQWAMIGCGAVVTHDVPDYAVVYGPYAKVHRECEE